MQFGSPFYNKQNRRAKLQLFMELLASPAKLYEYEPTRWWSWAGIVLWDTPALLSNTIGVDMVRLRTF
jgi:hypothetical protein